MGSWFEIAWIALAIFCAERDSVLKGRGFKLRRRRTNISVALAAEVRPARTP